MERRFRTEALPHFRYLWDRCEAPEREVVQRVLTGAALTPEHGALLETLEQRGVLERHGAHERIFSQAFERFVRQMVPDIAVQQEPRPLVKRRGTVYQPVPLPPGVHPFPDIIGESTAIRQVFALMDRVIATEAPVLLTGETGTGKELVARTIHRHSRRQDHPFVAVNCGAIPEHLQESEFFGHKKGAFTDAVADTDGLFAAAHGGTLFLDEVTEMSLATQVKLLRILQDGEIRRVGETVTRMVDVRVMCATNRDLEDEVAHGRFRGDLYYRLYVLVLSLPPLRERSEDIPLLIRHFLTGYPGGITKAAVAMLHAYAWPGNIREFDNQLAAAKAMAGGKRITPEHLWPRVQQVEPTAPLEPTPGMDPDQVILRDDGTVTLKAAREQMERLMIAQRLTTCGGYLETVAQSLGISKRRLYELLQRYGLTREREAFTSQEEL